MLAPALYTALEDKGRLDSAPMEVREALTAFHRLNADRNARLRKVLADTVRILNARGIEPLLLKGCITLLPGQGRRAEARMMSDLDIALVDAAPEQGEAALAAAGYWCAPNQGPADYPDLHHLAPRFHPGGAAYVEIHRRTFSDSVPAEVLPLAEICRDARPVDWNGLRLRVPSIEHRLLHNALHHQIQDGALRIPYPFALRQLLEFVQLCVTPAAEEVDWNASLSRLDLFGMGEPVRAYMLTAERLFALPLPGGVTPKSATRAADNLMWLLRSHPRLLRAAVLAARLPRLPRRLVTPGWYPEKYKHLLARREARRTMHPH